MVTADSSVWIDYLTQRGGAQADKLEKCLRDPTVELVVLDVVLMEVLRGFRTDHDYQQAYANLLPLTVETAGGKDIALSASSIYRNLRKRGITVRSSIDLLVAAWCLTNQGQLLHSDRDFNGIAEHYPLTIWSTS